MTKSYIPTDELNKDEGKLWVRHLSTGHVHCIGTLGKRASRGEFGDVVVETLLHFILW